MKNKYTLEEFIILCVVCVIRVYTFVILRCSLFSVYCKSLPRNMAFATPNEKRITKISKVSQRISSRLAHLYSDETGNFSTFNVLSRNIGVTDKRGVRYTIKDLQKKLLDCASGKYDESFEQQNDCTETETDAESESMAVSESDTDDESLNFTKNLQNQTSSASSTTTYDSGSDSDSECNNENVNFRDTSRDTKIYFYQDRIDAFNNDCDRNSIFLKDKEQRKFADCAKVLKSQNEHSKSSLKSENNIQFTNIKSHLDVNGMGKWLKYRCSFVKPNIAMFTKRSDLMRKPHGFHTNNWRHVSTLLKRLVPSSRLNSSVTSCSIRIVKIEDFDNVKFVYHHLNNQTFIEFTIDVPKTEPNTVLRINTGYVIIILGNMGYKTNDLLHPLTSEDVSFILIPNIITKYPNLEPKINARDPDDSGLFFVTVNDNTGAGGTLIVRFIAIETYNTHEIEHHGFARLVNTTSASNEKPNSKLQFNCNLKFENKIILSKENPTFESMLQHIRIFKNRDWRNTRNIKNPKVRIDYSTARFRKLTDDTTTDDVCLVLDTYKINESSLQSKLHSPNSLVLLRDPKEVAAMRCSNHKQLILSKCAVLFVPRKRELHFDGIDSSCGIFIPTKNLIMNNTDDESVPIPENMITLENPTTGTNYINYSILPHIAKGSVYFDNTHCVSFLKAKTPILLDEYRDKSHGIFVNSKYENIRKDALSEMFTTDSEFDDESSDFEDTSSDSDSSYDSKNSQRYLFDRAFKKLKIKNQTYEFHLNESMIKIINGFMYEITDYQNTARIMRQTCRILTYFSKFLAECMLKFKDSYEVGLNLETLRFCVDTNLLNNTKLTSEFLKYCSIFDLRKRYIRKTENGFNLDVNTLFPKNNEPLENDFCNYCIKNSHIQDSYELRENCSIDFFIHKYCCNVKDEKSLQIFEILSLSYKLEINLKFLISKFFPEVEFK